MYVCMYVCMYVRMYVCKYACICRSSGPQCRLPEKNAHRKLPEGFQKASRKLSESVQKASRRFPKSFQKASRWANIILGTKSVTRTLSKSLPLDSWEGHPRSDSGGDTGVSGFRFADVRVSICGRPSFDLQTSNASLICRRPSFDLQTSVGSSHSSSCAVAGKLPLRLLGSSWEAPAPPPEQ